VYAIATKRVLVWVHKALLSQRVWDNKTTHKHTTKRYFSQVNKTVKHLEILGQSMITRKTHGLEITSEIQRGQVLVFKRYYKKLNPSSTSKPKVSSRVKRISFHENQSSLRGLLNNNSTVVALLRTKAELPRVISRQPVQYRRWQQNLEIKLQTLVM
jgi:hypothetical protein